MTPATEALHRIEASHPLLKALRARELRTGHWFHQLLVNRLRAYAEGHPVAQAVETHPAVLADKIIGKASAQAALLGTGAAAITTSAEMWTAETQGMAGLLAVPAAGAAMLGDLVVRAHVTVKMSCEVAALFGVRFDPDDPSDLALLYAVALQAVAHPENSDARGHELLSRLVPLHSEEVSSAIGSMIGAETLARNVVPVLSLATSAITSYRVMRRIGEASLRYARARRALEDAFAKVERAAAGARDSLIEGVWFVLTSDGRLDEHEAAILAHLVRCRPADVQGQLLDRMRYDEADCLGRLDRIPKPARSAFLRALETAAALDVEITPPERELLASAARRLGEQLLSDDELRGLAERLGSSGLTAEASADEDAASGRDQEAIKPA
jgi:hypothetical protein